MLPLQAGALLGPMTGMGVVTLGPVLSDLYQVTIGTVGLTITAYMIPFALVQLFSGSISQVITGRRTVAAGFVVFAAGSLGCAAAPTFPLLLLFRFVQGVGAAFLFPVLMALVGEVVAPERLGRAIGAFGATQTLGLALGPLLAGLFEVYLGWRWFFVWLAAFAIAADAAFLLLFRGEREAARDEGGVLQLTLTVLGKPTVVLLSLAAAGLFFAMIGAYTYLAVWLKAVPRLSEDRVGIVLAVAGAVGIPASAVAGGWVDRFGRRAVGIAGLAGYITALLGLAALPYSFWGTVALAAWLGWTVAVAWAGLNTLAVEIDPALRKPVASIYNAVRFLGYSLAPPILGLVYGKDNLAGVLLASAAVVAVSAALVARLRLPRRTFP
ncbi:MAG: MFS transporter [Candidatus Rokubacteria bacterium]|nr:MFS transporter [Candidatus Rokubacteria bacterium]